MLAEPGQMVSHYRLIDKIGQGGMGVVWKATDTKLDREVAIKFLPTFAGNDAERLTRFEREAKLLASLNHANIASIFGLHEQQGLHFLAMELVPGEDLGKRLARGALPTDQALEIARQIAEALETAHAAGVVHRDLKPANVQLTPDGKVKVLDFGLAKATGGDPTTGTEKTNAPTRTASATLPGAILGTAGYMSPEQARGLPADRRSDIWAFGCVLYEMLAGRAPFRGATTTDTLAALLKSEPAWDALDVDTPRRIRALLSRCLRTEPRQRLHDIADARIVIEEALAGDPDPADAPAAPATSITAGRLAWASLLVVALIAAIALVAFLRPGSEPRPPRRVALDVEGYNSDFDSPPVISPTARHIAYVAEDRLWLLDLTEVEPREIAGTEGATHPFWSPDGAWIGYGADGRLWRAPVDGGDPVFVCDLRGVVHGGAWAEDDEIILAPMAGGMLQVPAHGGELTTFLAARPDRESDFHKPTILPDGRGVLFTLHRAEGIDTIAAVGPNGKRKVLLAVEGARLEHPVYSAATGHLLWARSVNNHGIWAAEFSAERLELTGEPFLVAPGGDRPSVSRDGTLLYIVGAPGLPRQLAFVDYRGDPLRMIGEPLERTGLVFPTLSPDGTRVSVNHVDNENTDIWIHDVEHGTRSRYSFGKRLDSQNGWTPDGSGLLYASGPEPASSTIFLGSADGSGEPRALPAGLNAQLSPDGRRLVFLRFTVDTGVDIWTLEMDDEGAEPRPFLQTEANEGGYHISPDGRYIAYSSDESGEPRIYLRPFPEGRGKWQVSDDDGLWPRFSPDGRKLIYSGKGRIWAVEIDLDGPPVIGTPRALFSGKEKGVLLTSLRTYDALAGDMLLVVKTVGDERGASRLVLADDWAR